MGSRDSRFNSFVYQVRKSRERCPLESDDSGVFVRILPVEEPGLLKESFSIQQRSNVFRKLGKWSRSVVFRRLLILEAFAEDMYL